MAVTIPFDPTLVLGNIVSLEKIKKLEKEAKAQQPVDAAQRKLNALILAKRSLDMTTQELMNMGVDTTSKDFDELTDEIESLKDSMVVAASDLAKATITSQAAIAEAQGVDDKGDDSQSQISDSVESPIDYNASEIKKLPLSSDSMVLDAQYFRSEVNQDQDSSSSNSIASYVNAQCSGFLSPSISTKVAGQAKDVSISQHKHHDIEGTIVITVNCTHRQAQVFAPYVMDVDKAVRSWNAMFKDNPIVVDDRASLEAAIKSDGSKDANVMNLLSGATYGSSFVGLVHILKREQTDTTQSSKSLASSLSVEMKKNLFLENISGGFGVSGSFAESAKDLLSTSDLQAHCSVIAMGIIPSIASNTIETTVATLQPDPQKVMDQLSAIQGSTDSSVNTMMAGADDAKKGQQFITLNNEYVKNAVSSLGAYDDKNNKVIDTNSLMTAMEDYIKKAIAGDAGVPINFFLKPITANELAEAYLDKYYPKEFVGEESASDQPIK
jgi:hypothetical protein